MTSSSSSSSGRICRRTSTRSPYFPSKSRTSSSKDAKGRRKSLLPTSCLPFPSIFAPTFGLIQERLAHDPFRLLIATIFLNRTRGEAAIPVLYSVFERYPTVEALATANVDELTDMIRRLGFQNARANKCVALARAWLEQPPCKGRRWRKLHYPERGDGVDIRAGECVGDSTPEGERDTRVAWEVAHLPGLGAYAIDSWRIFCRDVLRGLAADYNGRGRTAEGDSGGGESDGSANDESSSHGVDPAMAGTAAAPFEPEWKRVRPKDKELRAFLTWMWLKEGWVWNPETGERRPMNNRMRRAAKKGGILVPGRGGSWILEKMVSPCT
ncbi:hypothetical protein VTO42DRAFT_5400 [Malbranchea cinnamomea]